LALPLFADVRHCSPALVSNLVSKSGGSILLGRVIMASPGLSKERALLCLAFQRARIAAVTASATPQQVSLAGVRAFRDEAAGHRHRRSGGALCPPYWADVSGDERVELPPTIKFLHEAFSRGILPLRIRKQWRHPCVCQSLHRDMQPSLQILVLRPSLRVLAQLLYVRHVLTNPSRNCVRIYRFELGVVWQRYTSRMVPESSRYQDCSSVWREMLLR
jgi:hypothetical protein